MITKPKLLETVREGFTLYFPDGDGELTVPDGHRLGAHLRRAIDTGKPTGVWRVLAARPAPGGKAKLVGTVVWTEGQKFVFFPGTDRPLSSTHSNKNLNGAPLDHITLDLDSNMSVSEEHVAVLASDLPKTRGQFRTAPVHPGHLHPWFTLLLRSLDGQPDLPVNARFEFDVPLSDQERRIQAILGRGDGSTMDFPHDDAPGNRYFQLDVWAGRGAGWHEKVACAIHWPAFPDIVDGPKNDPVPIATYTHKLNDDYGIVAVLARPHGSLRYRELLVHAKVEPRTRAF